MPTVSRFYGIVISMYHNDHAPPHFHVKYAEHRAKVTISTLELGEGKLPRRALVLVLEWAALHRMELMDNWERAQKDLPLKRIDGLD